jgi:RNA polymerase sigma-70 factor (ECF subfamily)
MTNVAIASERALQDAAVMERFLDKPDEASFADLFKAYTPQLVAFFRARGCVSMAEDLAQEVMLTVYRKVDQVRDRALFRAWMFKIARNALSRHYGKHARELDTVDIGEVPDRAVAVNSSHAGTPAFEFNHWMAFLDTRESEALTLRFIEEWEYHEIAAAQDTPVGTAQWRVFNAKRKLAPLLKRAEKAELREKKVTCILRNAA